LEAEEEVEGEFEGEEASESSSDIQWIPADLKGPTRVGLSQFDLEEAPQARGTRTAVLAPGVPDLRPARDNVRGFHVSNEF
jgi:hypothetical protein